MNKENCALKLVDEIILYYDARSKKHQITFFYFIYAYILKSCNRTNCSQTYFIYQLQCTIPLFINNMYVTLKSPTFLSRVIPYCVSNKSNCNVYAYIVKHNYVLGCMLFTIRAIENCIYYPQPPRLSPQDILQGIVGQPRQL